MPHTITQDPEDLPFDSEGFPQIPLTETARYLRDLTASPSSSNNVIKVKSHYRRRKATKKKNTKKKRKESPLHSWLLPSIASIQGTSTTETVSSTKKQEAADRSLAFSLRMADYKLLFQK
jgi:hypothetical protein